MHHAPWSSLPSIRSHSDLTSKGHTCSLQPRLQHLRVLSGPHSAGFSVIARTHASHLPMLSPTDPTWIISSRTPHPRDILASCNCGSITSRSSQCTQALTRAAASLCFHTHLHHTSLSSLPSTPPGSFPLGPQVQGTYSLAEIMAPTPPDPPGALRLSLGLRHLCDFMYNCTTPHQACSLQS